MLYEDPENDAFHRTRTLTRQPRGLASSTSPVLIERLKATESPLCYMDIVSNVNVGRIR